MCVSNGFGQMGVAYNFRVEYKSDSFGASIDLLVFQLLGVKLRLGKERENMMVQEHV